MCPNIKAWKPAPKLVAPWPPEGAPNGFVKVNPVKFGVALVLKSCDVLTAIVLAPT